MRQEMKSLLDGSLCNSGDVLIGDEIPFVQGHDGPNACVSHLLSDALILRRCSLPRVDNQDSKVRPHDRVARTAGAENLDAFGLCPPANPRRIDEPVSNATDRGDGVHRISRGSRIGMDDRSVLPYQVVKQRRFANVRSANQSNRSDVGVWRVGRGIGKHVNDAIEKISGPSPV